MFCFKCGFDCGNSGWKFCPSCGASLEEVSKALSKGAEEYTPNDGGIPVEDNPFADSESMDWLENISYEDFEYEEREAPAKRVEVKTEPVAMMKVPCKTNFGSDFVTQISRRSSINPNTNRLDIYLGQSGDARPVESADPWNNIADVYNIVSRETGAPVPELTQITAHFAARNGIYYAKKSGGLFFMDARGRVMKLSNAANIIKMTYNASTETLEITYVTDIGKADIDYREPRGSQDYSDDCDNYIYAVFSFTTKTLTMSNAQG